MKKLLCTVAAATLFAGSAQAQLHSRNTSYVGLKLGGTGSLFVGDNAKNQWLAYGLHGGIFANLKLAQPFSIQPEVLYSMKGVKDNFGPTEVTKRLNYIDVPVAVRASTGGLFVEAGPQVGFLLSATSDATGESVSDKSPYQTVDFGYILGVGYHPQRGGLGAGFRYNGGLLSVYKDPTNGAEADDVRNSAFQLYLSYSASRNKKNKRSRK
jgi:hypothetical protein